MKSIITSSAFVFLALLASNAGASPLTLADVGGIDPLVSGGAANIPSGDATEKTWISGVLGIPESQLTYQKLTASGGANWEQISGSTDLFAFNLGSDPTWFMVKTGGGAPFNHYLFSNVGNLDWAVVDFDEFGFTEVNIEKIGHVATADGGGGSEDLELTPVPEPASLTMLGLGLSATAAAIRRRRNASRGSVAESSSAS
jgi:PEP-CTERM putative exosortase interaction domain